MITNNTWIRALFSAPEYWAPEQSAPEYWTPEQSAKPGKIASAVVADAIRFATEWHTDVVTVPTATGFRPATAGELTRGRRYLTREMERARYNRAQQELAAIAENRRTSFAAAALVLNAR